MKKKMSEFLSENFQFLVVKFSIYLNRRVFVMIILHLLNWIELMLMCQVFWARLASYGHLGLAVTLINSFCEKKSRKGLMITKD